jgi:hypothetical protein
MRYVYVVTRYVENESEGMKSIPNLGVHSSRKAAVRHWKAVLKNRRDYGEVQVNTLGSLDCSRYVVIEEARVFGNDGWIENLRLEQWKVRG